MHSLLFSLSLGLCVHLVLTLLAGPYSQSAYEELEAYLRAVEANVEVIEAQRRDLEVQIERLRFDPHLIEVEARKLLLYRDNELVVHLPREIDRTSALSPGAVVLRQTEPPEDRRPLFRSIALVSALLCFLLLTFLEPSGNQSSRRHSK